MPIAFACPSCGKKYRVDDNLAGKTAKCQGCGKAMKIPQPAAAAPAPAVPAKPKSVVPDGSEFGLDGIQAEDDLFAGAGAPTRGNPLGEQMIEDYGIAPVDIEYVAPAERNMEVPEFAANPAVQEYKKIQKEAAKFEGRQAAGSGKKGGAKSAQAGAKKKGNLFVAPAMIALYIMLPIQIICGVVGLLMASSIGPAVAGLSLALAGMINMGAQLWSLVKIIQNSKDNVLEIILCLFVPFYMFYYWIKYWDVMKGPVAMIGVAFLGITIGMVELIVVGMLATS